MRIALDVVGAVDLLVFLVLAVLAVRQWWRRRDPPALWAALALLALFFVLDVGGLVPRHPHGGWLVLQRVSIAVLLTFPYSLLRFTSSLEGPDAHLRRVATALTAAAVVWTLVVPHWPEPGEAWPAWTIPYLVLALGTWVLLAGVAIVRLWRAARGQPGVGRRRTRGLAIGATILTVALLTSVGGDAGRVRGLVVGVLAGISAVWFYLALAPPPLLRLAWRRGEHERFQQAVGGLLQIDEPQQLLAQALDAMAAAVGADHLALYDARGALLASRGDPPPEPDRIPFADGAVVVGASPYAPYFGEEERTLLVALASFAVLANERSQLLARERAARQALEQADELKTQFVAFAAHELRNPITSVLGLAQTLDERAAVLDPEMDAALRRTLHEQSRRAADLVDRLLDLSRLDAAAIEIAPQPVPVLDRVDALRTALAQGGEGIEAPIDPGLQATVDPAVFDHVVSNLLTNALRYGAPPVTVSALVDEGRLRLTVDDAGRGVDPAFVPQLFERFSRAADARAVEGGSGLGLAIARAYARAHGGDLRYEPRAPAGSRFELVLPAV